MKLKIVFILFSFLSFGLYAQIEKDTSLKVNFDSDLGDLLKYRSEFKNLDSSNKTFVDVDLKNKVEYLIANKYLILSENNPSLDGYRSTKAYLNTFPIDLRLDSCKRFFLAYLKRNQSRPEVNFKKVFTYWTDLSKFYQKLSYLDAIKYNVNFLEKENEFRFGISYIDYCLAAFPQDKLALSQIKRKFQVLLISNAHLDEVKKAPVEATEKNDTALDSNIHLAADLKLMNEMLTLMQFSSLSRLLNKNLLLFPQHPKLLALKKQLVINDYKQQVGRYKNVDENLYFLILPDASKCKPGILNNLGNLSVLTQLNYVRRLAGLYDSCVLNPAYAPACQQAALMMEANDDLDHHPPRNWKCYKHEAAIEAGNSNLSLGYGFNRALMGQMTDNGARNAACGHRRWILNPYNTVFGLGSTLDAMCLKVFATEDAVLSYAKNRNNFNDSQFVSWPSADFFPIDIAPSRWSFSLDGADFKGVTISVRCNGIPLNVKMEKQQQGFALNTVVWTIDKLPIKDLVYTVELSNVVNNKNEKKNYSYKVVFLDIK